MSAITFFVLIVMGAVGALLAAIGGLGVAITFWVSAAALATALQRGARGAPWLKQPRGRC